MINHKIKIREAIEEDYKIIDSLYRESYQLHFEAIPGTYRKVPLKLLPRGTYINTLEDKDSAIFVAEVDKKVLGVINITIEEDSGDEVTKPYRRVSVEELSVAKSSQRQGIGKALMQEAENWAKKKKITDLTVMVYSFNKQAIKFYEKNGYGSYSIRMNKKLKKIK